MEAWWNFGGTLAQPSRNLTSGPPRTTPEPIWAETPKLSAVGEKSKACCCEPTSSIQEELALFTVREYHWLDVQNIPTHFLPVAGTLVPPPRPLPAWRFGHLVPDGWFEPTAKGLSPGGRRRAEETRPPTEATPSALAKAVPRLNPQAAPILKDVTVCALSFEAWSGPAKRTTFTSLSWKGVSVPCGLDQLQPVESIYIIYSHLTKFHLQPVGIGASSHFKDFIRVPRDMEPMAGLLVLTREWSNVLGMNRVP